MGESVETQIKEVEEKYRKAAENFAKLNAAPKPEKLEGQSVEDYKAELAKWETFQLEKAFIEIELEKKKAQELISVIKNPLERLRDKNINPSSVEYLEMFHEYSRMREGGVKKTYIVVHLCEKYKIGRTKFFELIGCLDAEI